jgi:hypothetical protein
VGAWGYNVYGQLGDTPSGTPAQANVPVAVSLPSGTTIDALARGPVAFHALAVIGDLAVATGALPGGTVGVPYSVGVSATGGIGGDSWRCRWGPMSTSLTVTCSRG